MDEREQGNQNRIAKVRIENTPYRHPEEYCICITYQVKEHNGYQYRKVGCYTIAAY